MRMSVSLFAGRQRQTLALVGLLGIFLSIGLGPVSAQGPAPAAPKPAVLFVTAASLPLHLGGADLRRNMARLDGLGYRVAYYSVPELAQKPADFFQQFDVVVMLEQPVDPYLAPTQGPSPEILAVQAKQQAFLRAGGGLLIFLMPGYQQTLDRLLHPYGVDLLTGAYVDQAPVLDRLGVLRCAYTTQLAKDPRTEGVSGFWFPVGGKTGDKLVRGALWNANTTPFDVDNTWTVLASGGPSTSFYPFLKGAGADLPFQQQPRFLTMTNAQVPLVAVRDGLEGKGRLALCGVDMAMTNFCAGNTVYNGLCTGEGLEGKKSDLDMLLRHVVDWLGQGSLAAGRKTLAASDKASFAVEPFHYPPPEAVTKDRGLLPNPDQFVGLIGAQTVYSGGKSTVSEYAKTARELGLQYLIFLEDYATLQDAAWAKFEQECAANSDDKLLLIPGIRIQTERGVNFFGYRIGLKLPQPDFLVPGTRKLAQNLEHIFGEATWGEDNGPRYGLGLGNFRLEDKFPSGIPPENYNVYNPFVSLYTYQHGQLMDSMRDAYFKCAARTEWVSPAVVDLVDSAAELRSEWLSDHFKMVYLRDPGQGLNGFREGIGDRGYFIPTSYVTNGPKIEEWRSSNLDSNGSFWDWTRYRWFLRLVVSSDAGIKEVTVTNGLHPMYRFLPQGAKRFAQEIVLTHDDMHNLIVRVTDEQGRQAVSDEEWDKNQLFQLTWCADRNNMLSYSGLPAPKSPSGSTAGNYPAPNSMEKGGFRETLLPSVNGDRSRLPHFDGQPDYRASVYPAPSLNTGTESETCARSARDIGRALCSPDVAIQTASCKLVYDPSVQVVHPWLQGPLVPMKLFNADLRYLTFSHPDHQPAPVVLEGTIKILQDLSFSQDQRMGLVVCTMQAWSPLGGYDTCALQHSRTGDLVTKMSFTDNHVASSDGDFNRGAYVYFYPSIYGSAGLFSLTDDLIYSYRNRLVSIGFDTAGKTYQAGTELKYRLIAMISAFDELPSTQLSERFRSLMGLATPGQTGYTVNVEQGKILDSSYVLSIDGQGKGFAGEIVMPPAVPLPVSLPVVVENLNDHWTSVLYDREKQRLRPLGMEGNKAYCQRGLDERGGKIFLGHPFTLDHPELWLSVVQTGAQELTMQIHNPTDAAVTAQVTRSPYFDFVTCPDFAAPVPAGTTVDYVLTGAQAEKVGG